MIDEVFGCSTVLQEDKKASVEDLEAKIEKLVKVVASPRYYLIGASEHAGAENSAGSKTHGRKTREWKYGTRYRAGIRMHAFLFVKLISSFL